MNPIKSLVVLKYNILTKDVETWSLCETYPEEVRKNWAWRCALDVEHLAIGHKEAVCCIEVAKKYRDGLATIEELTTAYNAAHAAARAATRAHAAARAATRATYYAATATYYAAHAAARAATATYYAAHAAARAAAATKWVLYIEWLIEELCIWEEKQ